MLLLAGEEGGTATTTGTTRNPNLIKVCSKGSSCCLWSKWDPAVSPKCPPSEGVFPGPAVGVSLVVCSCLSSLQLLAISILRDALKRLEPRCIYLNCSFTAHRKQSREPKVEPGFLAGSLPRARIIMKCLLTAEEEQCTQN